MALYFCGNPICKGRIESDSVTWPLRCEKCNQQCYPENCQPGGLPDGGTSIRTRDHAFALPTAVLMVEGPRGLLVPFHYSPRREVPAPSRDAEPPLHEPRAPSRHIAPPSQLARRKGARIFVLSLLVVLGLVTAWILSRR